MTHSSTVRYNFPIVVSHWLLTIAVIGALALGWYLHAKPLTESDKAFYLDLHISLGVISFLFVILLLCFRVIEKPQRADHVVPWRERLDAVINILIYIVLILTLVSGLLDSVAENAHVRFWGIPLSEWLEQPIAIGAERWSLHKLSSWLLTGLIVIHILLAILPIGRQGISLTAMWHWRSADQPDTSQLTPISQHVKLTQKLAKNHRTLGWLSFWIQLLLAIVTGLLLSIAISGSSFGANSVTIGDGKFWARNGFYLLCIAFIISLYYTKTAKKISAKPDYYMDPKRKTAFWFLRVGGLVGTLGILFSIAGVTASILLLINKTISQPPGIAITDPTSIVRALDVFILLVNFILLIAHFVGTASAYWLVYRATQFRQECLRLVQTYL